MCVRASGEFSSWAMCRMNWLCPEMSSPTRRVMVMNACPSRPISSRRSPENVLVSLSALSRQTKLSISTRSA